MRMWFEEKNFDQGVKECYVISQQIMLQKSDQEFVMEANADD